MKRALSLLILLAIATASPSWALDSKGGSSSSGATACSGLSDAGTGCTTTVGPLATQGTITAQGVIASGGTLTCPFSATVTICTATVGGGAFTIGAPTGGVANIQYQIILSSTSNVTGTFNSAFTILNSSSSTALSPPQTFTSGTTGNTTVIAFHYDGSKYALDVQAAYYANRLNAANIAGGSVSGTTGSYTGILKSTVGAGTNPAAILSTFGTCNSTTEGLYATQSDAAVACVAGVTAAAGGSTHCGLYCNGSNWVRTGQ